MRVVVDFDQCDSTGLCADLAPQIFELDDDDVLHVRTERPGPDEWQAAEDAARGCPKLAIILQESG